VTSPRTAAQFVERLSALRATDEHARHAGGPRADEDDHSIGVRMGDVFALSKEFMDLAPAEIERLLDSPVHEVRVGAVSVMDWQARSRKTTEERRGELFELYLRRHDRIDTWDLVDRSAIWVVGEYLRDRPRDVLYTLARSDRPMERRTAILSTFAFIRRGDVDDALRIAELLVDDADDSVRKAVGWMLREVGKKEPARAAGFLDAHAATMPRVMLRYAIEKLDPETRARYLAMGRPGRPATDRSAPGS
jgi:3-methyladenine DNA glycosylase AlkD